MLGAFRQGTLCKGSSVCTPTSLAPPEPGVMPWSDVPAQQPSSLDPCTASANRPSPAGDGERPLHARVPRGLSWHLLLWGALSSPWGLPAWQPSISNITILLRASRL